MILRASFPVRMEKERMGIAGEARFTEQPSISVQIYVEFHHAKKSAF